jgi:uncharacterized protein YkwD
MVVGSFTSRLSQSISRTHSPVAHLLIAAAAVTSLSLILLVPAASAKERPCRHGNTPIGQARRAQLDSSVVCLINQQRRAHGLPGLQASPRLDRSAQGWTNAMVDHGAFTHGTDFAARITAVGFRWSNAGENIATGYRTPDSVVAAWMASTGHCQNILSPVFRQVGTGLSYRSIAGASTRAGTWTQDFGLIMGQTPPSGNYGPADGCPYR